MSDVHHPITDDLMKRLHDANQRLHVARLEWEKSMDASEYRHQERVDEARKKLDAIEREVEEVERKIQESL